MLKVYCHKDDGEDKLYLETVDHAEAIQFIKILVSAHGYDFQDIKTRDDSLLHGTVYGGYSDSEFCYIVEGERE